MDMLEYLPFLLCFDTGSECAQFSFFERLLIGVLGMGMYHPVASTVIVLGGIAGAVVLWRRRYTVVRRPKGRAAE